MSKPRIRQPRVSEELTTEEPELIMSSQESPTDMYILATDEAIGRRVINIIKPVEDISFEQVKNLYDALVEDTLVDGKLPENPLPIHVVCGTAGGDLNGMLGIMNLFLLSKIPIYTYVLSQTSSAGAFIFLAGSKRYAPTNGLASIMFHPTSWDGTGQRDSHAAFHAFIRKIEKNLTYLVQSRTRIPKKLLTDLSMSKTHYFVGDELFKYGIATDELVDSSFWNVENKE